MILAGWAGRSDVFELPATRLASGRSGHGILPLLAAIGVSACFDAGDNALRRNDDATSRWCDSLIRCAQLGETSIESDMTTPGPRIWSTRSSLVTFACSSASNRHGICAPTVTDISSVAWPLTLVLGKGGVGKSTVAHGLAELMGTSGGRAMVVEPGLGARLGHDPIREVSRRYSVERIDELDALRDAAAIIFGSTRLARAVMSQFAVRQLATVVPGLREVSLLVAALTRVDSGSHVVLDMPATGHGLAWLTTVGLLRSLAPAGRARTLVDRLHERLNDPTFTRLVVVTLCEPLVARETFELCNALPRPPDLIVINQVHRPPLLDASDLASLARLTDLTSEAAALAQWAKPSPMPLFEIAPTCELPLGLDRPSAPDVARALAARSS